MAPVPPEEFPREAETDASLDPYAIEEGTLVGRAEELFPLAWLAMLTVVSVIGIYNAVSRLPNF
jgi:hypothetical protein